MEKEEACMLATQSYNPYNPSDFLDTGLETYVICGSRDTKIVYPYGD